MGPVKVPAQKEGEEGEEEEIQARSDRVSARQDRHQLRRWLAR